MDLDVRWKQRFSNYQKALSRLRDAVALFHTRPLSDLEQQGLIQAFEYTHELAWKTIQDYLLYQGHFDIKGSRDAFRLAIRYNLITNGEKWMETIQARNLTSHAYDQGMAEKIVKLVADNYFALFDQLEKRMTEIENDE